MIAYETNYLAHHGVKGMKWGQRKQRILKGRKRGKKAPLTTSQIVKRRRASTTIGAISGMGAGLTASYFAAKGLSALGSSPIQQVTGTAAAAFGASYLTTKGIAGLSATIMGVNNRQLKNNPNVITVKKIH